MPVSRGRNVLILFEEFLEFSSSLLSSMGPTVACQAWWILGLAGRPDTGLGEFSNPAFPFVIGFCKAGWGTERDDPF